MSNTAKAYIAWMITLGAAAAGRGAYLWESQDLLRFLCYLGLALPASGLKVPLPGITGTMSVLFVFLLAGVAELSLSETLVIGTSCALVQSFWHAKVRPRAVQVLFSMADISIAITAADLVYHSSVLPVSNLQAPFRLALAASVFFVTNTFPIAAVIALTEGKSLRQVWADCYGWSFPYYLVGAAIVGVFSFANRMLDWQAWILILPVVYVIYRSYRLYLDQLENERRQAEEQRRHAAEVASLHAKTMEALASTVSANAKLDAVIQASPLAILSFDAEGRVSSWNAMAEHILGWSSEEALGRPMRSTGEESKPLSARVERSLLGELFSGDEVTHHRKDGASFEAAVWTAPLRDPAGRVSGLVMTVADVSDRKRLEQQLRFSQKMEAVGRLAGGIAHDFNNLLTIINGYSAMLVESLQADEYAANQAKEILDAGNRAADLVSRLLTFSRRNAVQPKLLEINELIRNVLRMLRRVIGEHIELRAVLDPSAGLIQADANQIEAVLMNLATNARDAMPNGGILTIETSRVDVVAPPHAPQPNLPAGSYVCLVVRDNGQGMDTETQQHLFEPFFTTKPLGQGTGLGLPSVYAGVQQSQGRIFVGSEVGKGTAFSIYLPRLEVAAAEEGPSGTAVRSSRGKEIILLVEDEAPLRRMLREALSQAGYRVWEAGNGAEGIVQWDSSPNGFDLLVTDVVMPVMNGLRLAEELKRRSPGLRVVFMSGHAEEVIARQGVEGNLDLLPKPFLPKVLVAKVREVLDQPCGGTRSALESSQTVAAR